MSESIPDWSGFFHVLSDPNRMRILQLLANGSEKSVSELSETLNQTQPAVSHHLAMLKEHGLIHFRRDGRYNRYSMVKDGFAKAVERLTGQSLPHSLSVAGLEIGFERIA